MQSNLSNHSLQHISGRWLDIIENKNKTGQNIKSKLVERSNEHTLCGLDLTMKLRITTFQ